MKDLVLYMPIGYPDENTFFRMLDMLDAIRRCSIRELDKKRS